MRTDVYRNSISHPSAWTATELGGVAGITYHLSDKEVRAIDEILSLTRHLKPQEVTKSDFAHRDLDPYLAELSKLIHHGRGVALITGLPPERYTEEDLERIFWGFGTHLGVAGVQSAWGERMGHVRAEPDNPNSRGYRSDRELYAHTDPYEIVGLMCVQGAESGGETQLVSALAMHNEILEKRPELLEPLYQGYRYANSEAKDTAKPITDEQVPVFCAVQDKVSVCYGAEAIKNAILLHGETLSPKFDEARNYFNALAMDDRLRMTFVIGPGEMIFMNNYTVLHARTNFKNSPGHQRHLLRLWLDVPDGRPVISELRDRAASYRKRADKKGRYVADVASN